MERTVWKIERPNGKGTGGMVRFSLHPANAGTAGYILMEIAPQSTIGTRGEPSEYAEGKKIPVMLGYDVIAKIIHVLRGNTESLDDGKGLFLRTDDASFILKMEHRIEPVPRYWMEVKRQKVGEHDMDAVSVCLTCMDATAMESVFSSALLYVTLGVPSVCA